MTNSLKSESSTTMQSNETKKSPSRSSQLSQSDDLLNNSSEISKFYANKCIFITGATGFLGKTLVEKLLRSCYDLKRIYILVRAKKGKSAQERLIDFFNTKVSLTLFFFNRFNCLYSQLLI
jgi:FlaA1/EpsC-like NDP-sugar epimerase